MTNGKKTVDLPEIKFIGALLEKLADSFPDEKTGELIEYQRAKFACPTKDGNGQVLKLKSDKESYKNLANVSHLEKGVITAKITQNDKGFTKLYFLDFEKSASK